MYFDTDTLLQAKPSALTVLTNGKACIAILVLIDTS